jgi:hypothetical protein
MKAEDHVIAWIESSREHYDRLLDIAARGKYLIKSPTFGCALLDDATRLVTSAYREMIRGGDALKSDPYSAADLAKAVALVIAWELEQ